ncbi:hypothetical protein ACF0H5_023577 [Mactra antiquata]
MSSKSLEYELFPKLSWRADECFAQYGEITDSDPSNSGSSLFELLPLITLSLLINYSLEKEHYIYLQYLIYIKNMAEDQTSSFEMQKELRETSSEKKTDKATDVSNNSCSNNSQASGNNLEDLFLTLRQQISNSDWLEKNTAEQWVEKNPELAKEYMEAAKKS